MEFKEQLNFYVDYVEKQIDSLFKNNTSLQKDVFEAMDYSLCAGGKRLRPVLTLACCDMFGGSLEDALRFAVGIECIHTYSLIHDDLPCMDDDDLRRGKPTCHKKFGEATALLAGDGLLTYAFEYMTDFNEFKATPADVILKVVNEISCGAGVNGMIGGQVVDLALEGKDEISLDILNYMHQNKTGQLIRVSVMAGALCGGADEDELKALMTFADNLGIAFQIQDDILDYTGDVAALGKNTGRDLEIGKTTYVSIFGCEDAKAKMQEYTDKALASLDMFGNKAEFLVKLTNSLVNRKN